MSPVSIHKYRLIFNSSSWPPIPFMGFKIRITDRIAGAVRIFVSVQSGMAILAVFSHGLEARTTGYLTSPIAALYLSTNFACLIENAYTIGAEAVSGGRKLIRTMAERKWHWWRGIVVSAAFFVGCWTHMTMTMTPNTSWEQSPFSGPLVFLHCSNDSTSRMFSAIMLAVLSGGLCLPAFRLTWWTLSIFLLSVFVWVWCSISAAAAAVC
jgi:hypothetical protein